MPPPSPFPSSRSPTPPAATPAPLPGSVPVAAQRLRVVARGIVQGVGFRPFVHRLAGELALGGWVANTTQGVVIEVEGAHDVLETFLSRLDRDKPPRAAYQGLESTWLDPVGFTAFAIGPSDAAGATSALVPPDIALCEDCRRELLDPADRRYRYPFINCTNCGPRYSILHGLPYDRPNTTMRAFPMCPDCRREYEDPADRRFHAQPNACPVCGPHMALWDGTGRVVSEREAALGEAVAVLRGGGIVAVKGVGGFHLMVDARDEGAVERLRARKHREEKPFAVMVDSVEAARGGCRVSEVEARLLESPEAPIVLLRRKSGDEGGEATRRRREAGGIDGIDLVESIEIIDLVGLVDKNNFRGGEVPDETENAGGGKATRGEAGGGKAVRGETGGGGAVAPAVAPGNPYLGLMLPYTPLHVLLLREFGGPLVATSGNVSDDPICHDEAEVLERLGGIADRFLVHNRAISNPVDDSIAREVAGRALVLRRGRGYAPLPIARVDPAAEPVLAVGGHLKNTVALSVGGLVIGSPHVGDLETRSALDAHRRTASRLCDLYGVRPARLACDLHPEYASTREAWRSGLPVVGVPHHEAHILSCMAENELEGAVCGISWDGTGYGLDGRVWGGEFFRTGPGALLHRVAHLRPFRLPGGERAVREPWRSALGLLFAIHGPRVFEREVLWRERALSARESGTLQAMLERGINAPETTSAGRLFDGVAALIGLRSRAGYEGQAAMAVEFAAMEAEGGNDGAYPFGIAGSEDAAPDAVDWGPLIEALEAEARTGVAVGRMASRFHNTLVGMIVEVARRTGEERVVLSGGCFQNACLTERAVGRLRAEGFRPYWHQRVPPNDGGLALGQLVHAIRNETGGTSPCV